MIDRNVNQANYLGKAFSDSYRIRKNLILKLGFDDVKTNERQIVDREPSRGSLLGDVNIFREPLKYELEEECSDDPKLQEQTSWAASVFGRQDSKSLSERSLSQSIASESSLAQSSEASSRTRKLSFNEEVVVCPIPRHSDYSKRIRERLWPSVEDLVRNAQRNTLEFASEGWNWRNALEDEDMYVDSVTEERIHPVHFSGGVPPM